GVIAAVYGLYLLFDKKTRIRGLVTAIISGVYFYAVLQKIIPSLSPYGHYLFGSIYGTPLGASIGEIMLGAIRNPRLFMEVLMTLDNLTYVRDLLLPVFPFVLFSPMTLGVAASALAQNLLSLSSNLKLHILHYESGAVPFIYASTV